MFGAALEPLKLGLDPRQFLTHNIPLAKQIVPLGDQGRRDGDVARTTAANQRGRRVLTGTEWTNRRHGIQGATFKTKLVLPTRPSESLMSILTMWSPAGNSASGMSMPVGCTKGLMRGVRSTLGVLR